MKELGIDMIAAYSPEARGAFGTRVCAPSRQAPARTCFSWHRDKAAANRYLKETYLSRFNAEFKVPAVNLEVVSSPTYVAT